MAKPKTKSKPADPKATSGQADDKSTSSSSSFPHLPEGAHDLASLRSALGEPTEAIKRILFRHQSEASFYEWGIEAETGNILADVPRFVSSALHILAALDPARRALVLIPPQTFAALVDEAVTLESMSRGHDVVATSEAGGKTDREVTLKRRMSEGVSLRDRVIGSLRSAAGDSALSQVRKPASDASSPEALAKGLNAVATFIEETLKNGNDDDAAALAAFQVGEDRAAELRAAAAAIQEASKVTAATGKRVSKRALDIQDGRVLALIDVVHRAFRLARRSDKSILMPELSRLAPLFATGGSGAAKECGAPEGGKPVTADNLVPA